MSKEKQTDPLHWRNRLDDLEAMPGEDAFNKKAAWEMLDNRLQEKPRRIKAIWYWAAACLLLLMAIPMLIKTTADLPTKVIVDKRTIAPSPAAPVVATDKNEPAVIVSSPVIKKTPALIARKNKPVPLQHNDTGTKGMAVIAANALPDKTNNNEPAAVTDTTAAVAKIVSVPVKKRLPVVHINELDKHDQETAQFATHGLWRVFQVKLLSQDNAAANALPPANTQQDLIKVKIPLKN